MRRLSLIALVSLLALPASALASTVAVGDGTLAVASANVKSIVVVGHGLIYGYVDQGVVTVLSYTPDDNNQYQISGSAPPKPVGTGARYTGSAMRFLISGSYTIKFEGSGINLSAVGKGTVTALGADATTDLSTSSSVPKLSVTSGTSSVSSASSDGTLAVNGGKPQPIAHSLTSATFGSTKLGQ